MEKLLTNLDDDMMLFAFRYSIFRNRNIKEWMLRQGKDFSLRSKSELVRFQTANNCKR